MVLKNSFFVGSLYVPFAPLSEFRHLQYSVAPNLEIPTTG